MWVWYHTWFCNCAAPDRADEGACRADPPLPAPAELAGAGQQAAGHRLHGHERQELPLPRRPGPGDDADQGILSLLILCLGKMVNRVKVRGFLFFKLKARVQSQRWVVGFRDTHTVTRNWFCYKR